MKHKTTPLRSLRTRANLLSPSRTGRLLPALLGAALVAAVCVTAAEGATVSLIPSQDNSIYSEGDNSNALGPLFTGETPNLTVRRALLEFNIATSGIPAGATINAVSLALTQTKIGPAGSATFELHPLLAAWGEGTSVGTGAGGSASAGDATWNFRLFNTNSWATPGGDFGATSGTTVFGTTNTTYMFLSQPGLVADVQNWLNSPGSNFGWILRAANESAVSARELGSRESSPGLRPTLTINYPAAPEPGSIALLGLGTVALARRRRRGAGQSGGRMV